MKVIKGGVFPFSFSIWEDESIMDSVRSKAHPHAVSMAQYAIDMATDASIVWQCKKYGFEMWVDLNSSPKWELSTQYRRKPIPSKLYFLCDHSYPAKQVALNGAPYEQVEVTFENGVTHGVATLIKGI